MTTLIGLGEFSVFIFLAQRALRDTDKIIDNLIYMYLCNMFNYILFVSVPWLNIGFSLYASDCTILLLLLIILAKKVPIKKRWTTLWVSVLLMMAIASAIRGLMRFGFSSDFFADLRKYLYFIIAVIYAATIPIKREWRYFEKKLDKLYWFLTLYSLVILAFYFAGMPLGERSSNRPLISDIAIVYAAYIAIKWYEDLLLSERVSIRWSTVLFTITLILNRFNTTWVALLVSILIMVLMRSFDKNKKQLNTSIYIQLIALILFGAVFLKVFGESSVVNSLQTTMSKFDASQDNTFSSRLELWGSMMATAKGISALIGYPFGNGFYVIYRGGLWQTIPHNGYIETLLRLGYIGLFALVAYMVTLIINAIKRKSVLPIMLCAVCMVYWYSYQLTLEQGIIIGTCSQFLFRWREEYELDNIY